MNVIGILFAFCALHCNIVNAAPVKRIDQRQDGDLNIQAHLDKIVLLIVPNKNINILDIKGQAAFDQYEDILPLLGKENVLNDLKYKLSQDDVKIKTLIGPDVKDEKKETPIVKIESKIEPKESKDTKKSDPVRETTSKKGDEAKASQLEVAQKRNAPKSDGRTYQTLQTGNRERVIAISSQEMEPKKVAIDLSPTKIEHL